MSAKLQINTRVRRLMDYIEDIENGIIQIPGFQRDFIWTLGDMLDLFSSLKMGYPIGSILFWKPGSSYGEAISIGPYRVPAKDDNYFYVLDGFQRISTLFGCLINPNKTNLEKDPSVLKNFRIYYDLKTEEFAPQRSNTLEYYQIPVYKLIDNKETFIWQRQLFDKDEEEIELYLERYEQIGNTLLSFYLPSIDIIGGEVEEAIDIFWRLNSKGSTISPDWILSARTYDLTEGFRLGTEIDNLLEELKVYNFGGIKRDLILQCIQSSFGKIYFEMKTEDIVKRNDFRNNTIKTIESIKKAVKFLFEELLVVDSRLLPANIQLIFCTEFFNKINIPTRVQLDGLKTWFWKTTYSNYFTVFSPSKRKEAFNEFLKFLDGKILDPFYNDRPSTPFTVSDFPTKIFFGSVRAKALVLFLLNKANSFENVDVNDVEGVNLSYLFYNVRNSKGDFPPASLVPTIKWVNSQFAKSKDMSFLLTDCLPEYNNKYFISQTMTDLFYQSKFEEIIEMRMARIIEAEKGFVESLGLKYDEENSLGLF